MSMNGHRVVDKCSDCSRFVQNKNLFAGRLRKNTHRF